MQEVAGSLITIKQKRKIPMITCKICFSQECIEVFQHNGVPEYNLHFYEQLEDALQAPSRVVQFFECMNCGFLFNHTYKQLTYEVEYEAGRSQSTFFTRYLKDVVSFLYESVSELNSVVEVGAGDCEFAKEFCKINASVNYFAYDPSWKKVQYGNLNNITFLPKYYDSYTLNYPDIVIARHVLEHQSDVQGFIKTLVSEKPKYLFIEIPCSSFVLDGNYHYFSYEHCSYFDKESLNFIMNDYGYALVKQDYFFNKENLISLYRSEKGDKKKKKNLKTLKKDEYYEIKNFNNWMDSLKNKFGKNDVIWGVGGKGVMLLNLLGLNYQAMPKVIDINSKLTNKYIPITGNKIVIPSEIDFRDVDTVHVSNKLYLEEIKSSLEKYQHLKIKPLIN